MAAPILVRVINHNPVEKGDLWGVKPSISPDLLLASKAELLRGVALYEPLAVMEDDEFAFFTAESTRIKDFYKKKFIRDVITRGAIALSALAILASLIWVFATQKGHGKAFALGYGSLVFMGFSFCAEKNSYESKLALMNEISNNRISRLRDKVRDLTTEIGRTVNEEALRHLNRARDYFVLHIPPRG